MSYVETVTDPIEQSEGAEIRPNVRTMLSFRDFKKELIAGVRLAKKHRSDITLLLLGIKDQPDSPINMGDLLTLTLESLDPLRTVSVVGPANKDQFAVILRGVDILNAIPVALDLSSRSRSILGSNLSISLASLANQDDTAANINVRATLGLGSAENDPKGIVIADKGLFEEDLPEDVRGKVTLEHI